MNAAMQLCKFVLRSTNYVQARLRSFSYAQSRLSSFSNDQLRSAFVLSCNYARVVVRALLSLVKTTYMSGLSSFTLRLLRNAIKLSCNYLSAIVRTLFVLMKTTYAGLYLRGLRLVKTTYADYHIPRHNKPSAPESLGLYASPCPACALELAHHVTDCREQLRSTTLSRMGMGPLLTYKYVGVPKKSTELSDWPTTHS